jgi:FO synthase
MNESISRAAGASHGQEMTPEELDAAIYAIGRVPTQRNTLYEPVIRRAYRARQSLEMAL